MVRGQFPVDVGAMDESEETVQLRCDLQCPIMICARVADGKEVGY